MECAIKNNESNKYESIVFNSDVVQTEGMTVIKLDGKIDDSDKFSTVKRISSRNTITNINYPETVDFKLISDRPFNYTIPGVEATYYDKKKVEDYLYKITYGNIDYEYAFEHFDPVYTGACSAIRNGNFFGRNFDWLYDNSVQFIVRTPKTLKFNEVIGVAGIVPGINKNNVEDAEVTVEGVKMFKLVPFYMLDGINDRGLFCTHNIVPLDNPDSPTVEIPAKKEELYSISAPMLVRFVLDRFSSAKEAIEYVRDYVTVSFPESYIDAGKQSHFMIGDSLSTYIVEFINSELVYTNKYRYMTNFNLTGVSFDEDGKVVYPPTSSGIAPLAFGLERWDLIVDSYDTVNTEEGMRELLEKIKYSNCYKEFGFWYSELTGQDSDVSGQKITVDTPPEDCDTAKATAIQNYNNRSRNDPKTWITCHASVYDLKKKILYIKNQEGNVEWVFYMK